MSQPTKPTSTESKTKEKTTGADQALPDAELEKVSGGKATFQDMTFTHKVDKASP